MMPYLFRRIYIICSLVLAFISFVPVNAQTESISKNDFTTQAVADTPGKNKPSHYKPKFIARLPKAVKETSGLIFSDGQLWTLNDGGNPPELFQVDTLTGRILHKIVIGNAVNSDWESITQDSSSIYIGDFGNNFGNRKDLHILKISKTDLLNPAIDTVLAGIIYFSYPDQADFTSALNKNNFDCEAFFSYNDSLHLFSKDWSDLLSKHYVLPADTGTYTARFAEQFYADGLITDASINEHGNIVLLGYKNTGGKFWECFCWLLDNYSESCIFNGRKTRLKLGSAFHLGQAEGIFLKNDNTGWISSESIFAGGIFHAAKLFSFDFNNFFTLE